MDALSGEILAGRPETVVIGGVPAGHMGPTERRRLRGCFVPEERNGHGAVTTMSLSDNAFLSGFGRGALLRFGFINRARTDAFARRIIEGFDVRTTGPAAQARSLSGGNLQKFLVGREVMQDPAVLVINQPTWGVDAGAALAIHEAIMSLAQAGAAVVIISQDLDEIFVLADRIAVLAGGRMSEPVPARSRHGGVHRTADGRRGARGRSCLGSRSCRSWRLLSRRNPSLRAALATRQPRDRKGYARRPWIAASLRSSQ